MNDITESTQDQELIKDEQKINMQFAECKSPQAKDNHAQKTLDEFERDYPDINQVIEILDKDTAKLNLSHDEKPLEQDEQDETHIDREKNELERAMDGILNARGLIDIIKALYAIEKAMYELNLASKKPDPHKTQEEIKQSKDKPLTMNFLKESIKKLREGKNKITEFSRNIRLQRAFAKELNKDIQAYELVKDQESKSAYEKRIDKKLIEAREKFPDLQDNFPKMLKNASKILKSSSQELVKGVASAMIMA